MGGRSRVFAVLVVVAWAPGCGGYRAHGTDAGMDATGPDCASFPDDPGCPCDAPEPVQCYAGPDETVAVGPCRMGLRWCRNGGTGVRAWSECEGQVVPREETCNGVDDDCDGETDEGVLSECGNCDPFCTELRWGHDPGDRPFDPESGWCVELTPEGALVLDDDAIFYGIRSVWIVNTPEGTISRIDDWTREEAGRYRTGASAETDSPSRTTVDFRDDVYVANRAHGAQASVTKVRSRCADEDDDGVVRTSSGRDDVLPWGEDECVAWCTEVGARDAEANALAYQDRIGLDGVVLSRVWVGLATERRYVELEAEEGAETGISVGSGGCAPHGAAVDRDGNLWSACGDSQIFRIDTHDPDYTETLAQPGVNEGIVVDPEGRVWTGGDVTVYDPESREWATVDGVRGYGVDVDWDSYLWVGDCEVGGENVGTCKVDTETLEVTEIDADSRAVAVDGDGYVWGIPRSGTVDVIDPDRDEVEARILDDCDGPGGACLVEPDAYSDMVGFQIRSEPSICLWQTVAEPCAPGHETTWVSIDWEVEAAEGTGVLVGVRTADSLSGLEGASWVPLREPRGDEPPSDLGAVLGERAHGRFLGVKVELYSGHPRSSPVLHSVAIRRSCR